MEKDESKKKTDNFCRTDIQTDFDINCDICTIPGTNDNVASCIYRRTTFGEGKIVKEPNSDGTPSSSNAVVLYKKELNLLLKLLQQSAIKDGHGH